MSEIIVNDGGNDSVLAEAAVASTALAGAALVNSETASKDAQNAESSAEVATEIAMSAHQEVDAKPSHQEVEEIAEKKVGDMFARFADILEQRLAPAAQQVTEGPVVEVESVPEEVAPRSVEKAAKTKRTFRERYLGLE